MTPRWIADLKRLGVGAVAAVLGMEPRGRGGWAPCPACSAERRGNERRAPIGTNARGGWRCHSCQAEGDAADLLSYGVAGARYRDLSDEQRIDVRTRAEREGLVAEDGGDRPAPKRAQPLASGRVGAAPTASLGPSRSPNRGGGRPRTEAAPEASQGVDEDPSGRPPPWDGELCDRATATLWDDPAAEPVRQYLMGGMDEAPGGSDGRALPEATCRAWKLGAIDWLGWWWVVIPMLDPRSGDPVNAKFCRVPNSEGLRPKPKYTSCGGRPLTLFGQRSLTNDLAAPVIVVEGELDVLALWAYGYQGSVVSGTAGAGAFLDEWLDVLEPYEQFVLAYDVEASGKGDEGAADLADKLGKHRCSRANLPRKDASECWLYAIPPDEITAAIDRAKPYVGLSSVRLDAYAAEIEEDIRHPDRLLGLPTGSPGIDRMISGWSDGLHVFTGGTKSGKSSLTNWLLMRQAQMGVPTLVTSFENGEKPAVHKFLRMQLGGDFLLRSAAERAAAFSGLGAMPLHIVERRGMVRLDDLVETIRYHRRRHGVRVALIDHIGFLVDLSKREDELKQLNHAVRTLTITANDERMAIMAIAHPVGAAEREGRRVRVFDIKGSSNIQQDCSTGMSLEWDRKVTDKLGQMIPNVRVHVDIFRGMWGAGSGSSCLLYYDPASGLYSEDMTALPCHQVHAKPRDRR
jgi:hypothetical protein